MGYLTAERETERDKSRSLFCYGGEANSALSKDMQGTAEEKKRESANRSAPFHLTVYAGHVREGLTQIITGFNGRNSRETQCATEPVMEDVQQAVVREFIV